MLQLALYTVTFWYLILRNLLVLPLCCHNCCILSPYNFSNKFPERSENICTHDIILHYRFSKLLSITLLCTDSTISLLPLTRTSQLLQFFKQFGMFIQYKDYIILISFPVINMYSHMSAWNHLQNIITSLFYANCKTLILFILGSTALLKGVLPLVT